MPPPLRVAIVGAGTLLGQEVGTALRERQFPMRAPQLLDDLPAAAGATAGEDPADRWLRAFGDEPALIEAPAPGHFENLDVVFFAGPAAQTRRHFESLRGHQALAVDLQGALREAPQAERMEPGRPAGPAAGRRPRLVVVPHPAGAALLAVLRAVQVGVPLAAATAVIVEPASERGQDGVFELQQQTLGLLRFQPLPTAIFDSQVSFNLRAALGPEAAPELATIAGGISRDLQDALRGDATPVPAVQVLQGAMFHSHALSICLQTAAPSSVAALERALRAAGGLEMVAEPPHPVAAAGRDVPQLGPVVADAAAPRSFWLFLAVDNLRSRALAAVDIALHCLGMAGPGSVT